MRLIWLLTIFLVGCDWSQNSVAPTQQDLDRIATILDQDRIILTDPQRISAPVPELRLSNTRISFGDALELGECGLLPLIAERNSSLGRQKQESIRLVYEWQLKVGLDQCAQFADQEWFQKARVAKAKDVEIAVLHLLTRSEEADRIHLKINRPLVTLSDSRMAYINRTQPVIQVLLQALQYQTPPETEAMTQFEEALYAWSQTQHHGTLHQAIINTRDWLNAANQLQVSVLKQNTICPMGTPTEQGRYVQAFIRDYYVPTIQPKLLSIKQAIDEIDSIWSVLPTTLWTQNTLIDALLKLPKGFRAELQTALTAHINHWQHILQSCGLKARADTTNS
ncbi:MAG: DUF3080 family protein [Pseudomonadota bacterium]|nr:DUF3080 family protein [Pseudomonadota bacterium]